MDKMDTVVDAMEIDTKFQIKTSNIFMKISDLGDEIMKSNLLKIFPEYLNHFNKVAPPKFTNFITREIVIKSEILQSMEQLLIDLKDVEYPKVISKHKIYDDISYQLFIDISKEENLEENLEDHSKCILEIRTVMLAPDVKAIFYIFTEDNRYDFLMTLLIDNNTFRMECINENITQNADYKYRGIIRTSSKLSSGKKFENKLSVPDYCLDIYSYLISLITEFHEINSLKYDEKFFIENDKFFRSNDNYTNSYFDNFLNIKQFIFIYQSILDYISSLGVKTNNKGEYYVEEKKSFFTTNEIMNPNISDMLSKGLLNIDQFIDFMLNIYNTKILSDEDNKLLEGDIKFYNYPKMNQHHYFISFSLTKIFETQINFNSNPCYIFIPLIKNVGQIHIEQNRFFTLNIRSRSKLTYTDRDIYRKIIQSCIITTTSYPIHAYCEGSMVICGYNTWYKINPFPENFFISFYETNEEKYINIITYFISMLECLKLDQIVTIRCDKCKGYITERNRKNFIRERNSGGIFVTKLISCIDMKPSFGQCETSPICMCRDEITYEELMKRENEKIEAEQREIWSKDGYNYDIIKNGTFEQRKAHMEEVQSMKSIK